MGVLACGPVLHEDGRDEQVCPRRTRSALHSDTELHDGRFRCDLGAFVHLDEGTESLADRRSYSPSLVHICLACSVQGSACVAVLCHTPAAVVHAFMCCSCVYKLLRCTMCVLSVQSYVGLYFTDALSTRVAAACIVGDAIFERNSDLFEDSDEGQKQLPGEQSPNPRGLSRRECRTKFGLKSFFEKKKSNLSQRVSFRMMRSDVADIRNEVIVIAFLNAVTTKFPPHARV